MPRGWITIGAVCLAALGSGCVTIKAVTIGQKTAYERQLLGTYDELDDELALIASVRADDARVSAAGAHARALQARRRQLFNLDDLRELRRLGCVGEAADGRVEARACAAAGSDGGLAARARRVAEQECADRATIIALALEADPTLTVADREALGRIWAELIRTELPAGAWYQDAAGAWRQVP